MTGRKHLQFVKLKLRQRSLGERDMRHMRRIKSATKYANSPFSTGRFRCQRCRAIGHSNRTERSLLSQTQARGTRNSVYRRSSADPASTGRWYDQLASGGIDIKMDSVRPPDCKPKCVPRSHTRLNST